jgi:hypothetical protein
LLLLLLLLLLLAAGCHFLRQHLVNLRQSASLFTQRLRTKWWMGGTHGASCC